MTEKEDDLLVKYLHRLRGERLTGTDVFLLDYLKSQNASKEIIDKAPEYEKRLLEYGFVKEISTGVSFAYGKKRLDILTEGIDFLDSKMTLTELQKQYSKVKKAENLKHSFLGRNKDFIQIVHWIITLTIAFLALKK